MEYRKNKFVACFKIAVSTLAVFAFSFHPVLAQTTSLTNGQLLLTTSPLPINLKVTPGTSISTPIKIKNDGNQEENLKVTLMKFKADPTT